MNVHIHIHYTCTYCTYCTYAYTHIHTYKYMHKNTCTHAHIYIYGVDARTLVKEARAGHCLWQPSWEGLLTSTESRPQYVEVLDICQDTSASTRACAVNSAIGIHARRRPRRKEAERPMVPQLQVCRCIPAPSARLGRMGRPCSFHSYMRDVT